LRTVTDTEAKNGRTKVSKSNQDFEILRKNIIGSLENRLGG